MTRSLAADGIAFETLQHTHRRQRPAGFGPDQARKPHLSQRQEQGREQLVALHVMRLQLEALGLCLADERPRKAGVRPSPLQRELPVIQGLILRCHILGAQRCPAPPPEALQAVPAEQLIPALWCTPPAGLLGAGHARREAHGLCCSLPAAQAQQAATPCATPGAH